MKKVENRNPIYMCYWDNNSYFNYLNKETDIKELSFFTIANGYTMDEITEILSLNIGETLQLDNGAHVITRLKIIE